MQAEELEILEAVLETIKKFSIFPRVPNITYTIRATELKSNPSRFFLDELDRNLFTIAVAVPYVRIYNALLEEGFMPAYKTEFLPSPLEMALRTNNKEAMQTLLQNQLVTSEVPPQLYEATLNAAAREGDVEAVRLFLRKPHNNISVRHHSTMKAGIIAMCFGHIELAKLLLRRYGRRPSSRREICLAAARDGLDDILEEFLDDRVDASYVLRTCVREEGCVDMHLRTAQLLVQHGAQPYERHWGSYNDCFKKAAATGRVDLMEVFFSAGYRYSPSRSDGHMGIYPYHDTAVLQFLYDHGFDFQSPKAMERVKWCKQAALTQGMEDQVGWFNKVLNSTALLKTSEVNSPV
jgi:hypothetical protein